MSSMESCVWKLGSQLVMLLWEMVGTLGDRAWLEEVTSLCVGS